ncbi:TetR/AcrR family transcriptional regulator [Arthrobacter crusticola]|uniref:TetR/AcrR family transcriptional regulator n=1 Tax=Arthrobacter crusticola TaxID=2547960 RepID=A0A4R5U3F1_9MICC|nr:TetR/AcrR family transcriptional regulator [Arthrobacter crusticola]TDK28229.1 TetR/AcrR family transcriptional regulator [Arthrobacter crusticola]
MDVQPSTRERLLDATEDLAFTQGVAATPVDEILRSAGVAPATLYAHFGNKEGLITQALERRLMRWDEAWQLAIDEASTPREKLLAVFPALTEYRRGVTAARWCAFLGVAAESPRPGPELQKALASDTQLLTSRLRELAVPVVGANHVDALVAQLVLVYTGVLGMLLRGMDAERAVELGLHIAGAAVEAAAGTRS